MHVRLELGLEKHIPAFVSLIFSLFGLGAGGRVGSFAVVGPGSADEAAIVSIDSMSG